MYQNETDKQNKCLSVLFISFLFVYSQSPRAEDKIKAGDYSSGFNSISHL